MINKIYFGICEDRNDPLKLGRCKVRIFGVHSDSKVDIPTADLPWAMPIMPLTSASVSGIGHSPTGPVPGSIIALTFLDGESTQQPIMLGTVPSIPKDKNTLVGTIDDETSLIFSGNTSPDLPSNVVKDEAGNPISTGEGGFVTSDGTTVTPSSGPVPVVTERSGFVTGKADVSGLVSTFGNIVNTVLNDIINAGITNPYTQIAILSNIAKECKFVPRVESLIYKSTERLRRVFPSRFNGLTDEQAATYLNNEQKLGDYVYASIGGFRYRGRGFIQLTGISNYRVVGNKIAVDLVNNPDILVTDPAVSSKASIQFFLDNASLARLNSFQNQSIANREITQIVGGSRLNLSAGIGADQLSKVNRFSQLAQVVDPTATVNSLEGQQVVSLDPNTASEVKNPGASDGLVSSNVTGQTNSGFTDPDGKFPRYFNEQDVSRLARNEKTNLTSVAVRERALAAASKVQKANDTGEWNPPENAYNAQYPYNHVYESESGHVMEFDDTPANERVAIFHKTGTFTEIDANGTQINRIVGDSYEILERDGYVLIKGACNVRIEGEANLVVEDDAQIQVNGDVNMTVGNDLTAAVAGSVRISSTEQAYVQAEEMFLSSYSGQFNITSAATLNLSSTADLNIKSAALLNLSSAGNLNIKSGGNVAIEAGGTFSAKSGGNASIDGAQLYWNSGQSGAAGDAAAATFAGLDVPGDREDVVRTTFPKLTLPPKTFEELTVFEGEDGNDAPVSYTNTLERQKLTDEEKVPATDGGSTEVKISTTDALSPSCDTFIGLTDIPMSLQLSPNFKLADMCQGGSRRLVNQRGLTVGRIACNLKGLAQNVLEPILAKYGPFTITSAFRTASASSGTSQHPTGEAVDIVFTQGSTDLHHKIATELAASLPYDQIILEYLPKKRTRLGGPTVWIHVSLRADGRNRKQVFTMSDHKRVSSFGELKKIY